MISELIERLRDYGGLYPGENTTAILCRDARECIEELAASPKIDRIEVLEDKVNGLIRELKMARQVIAQKDKDINSLLED